MVMARTTRVLKFLRRVAAHEVLRLAALVGIAAFLADFASKSWALDSLDGSTAPLGALVLGVERNDAFAFSSGSSVVSPKWVFAARLFALCGIAFLARRAMAASRRSAAGFGLLLGGGFGNAADVAFRGAVVDFIGAGPFTFDWAGDLVELQFVFNGADLAILMGLGLLAPLISASALAAQRRLIDWESRWFRQRKLFLF
jgi:lipoprotein signal peptidase